MRRWPAYKLDDVSDLTPDQILWHLEREDTARDTLTFNSMADYERWLSQKTKS